MKNKLTLKQRFIFLTCLLASLAGLTIPRAVLAQAGEADGILGTIEPPEGVKQYNEQAGGQVGLVLFASNIIRVITIGAGVWVMFNFIMAGFKFVMSFGNVKAYDEVRDSVLWSLVGLVIIAISYTLAAIVGLLFFGDAMFILNPKLFRASTLLFNN